MPWARPHVVPPGNVVHVRRPEHGDITTCHCTLNVSALVGSAVLPLPLSRCQLHELQLAVPTRFQACHWELAFDTEVDGFSLPHFYRKVADWGESPGVCLLEVAPRESLNDSSRGAGTRNRSPPPTVESTLASPLQSPTSAASPFPRRHVRSDARVVGLDGNVTDAHTRSVIGCFASELPNLRHNPHHFYGTGETFVFNLSRENGSVQTHGWNRSGNEEFLLSSLHFLGIGGGRDGAAIFLDESLEFGTSSVHCQTFDCPALFGRARDGLHHSEFVVVRMVWFALRHRNNRSAGAAVAFTGVAHDDYTSSCLCGRGAHSHHCSAT